MKELILVLYMCSAVADTCMPPFKWPERFEDSFTCMVKGYEEAARKTIEIATMLSNEKIKPINNQFDQLSPSTTIGKGSSPFPRIED